MSINTSRVELQFRFINQWLINMLLLGFPSLMLLVQPAASIVLGVAVLWSLVVVWFVPSRRKVTLFEKRLGQVILLFIFVVLISLLVGDFNYQGVKEAGRYARLLAYFFLLAILIRGNVNKNYIYAGFSIGAILAGGHAFYEVFVQGNGSARGDSNTILFGAFSALCALVVVVCSVDISRRNKLFAACVFVLFLPASILAVVLSDSLGAWLTLPSVFLVGFYILWGAHGRNAKKAVILLMAGLALILSALWVFVPNFQSHLKKEYHELSNYLPGKSATSLGLRLDMWNMSWNAFQQSPVLGIGQGLYKEFARENQNKVPYHPALIEVDMNHSHNEYFFTAASRGGVGLFTLLVLFIYPLVKFISAYRHSGSHRDPLLFLGAGLIVCYMHFCMGEAMFARAQAVAVFVVFLSIFTVVVSDRETGKDE